jgi:hypothetical protein
MKILSPDQSKSMLQLYHRGNFYLLPLFGLSYFVEDTPYLGIKTLIQSGTVMTYGYHSYVSTSFILTDYIKPKTLQSVLRVVNTKTHLFATLGFLKMIFFQTHKNK